MDSPLTPTGSKRPRSNDTVEECSPTRGDVAEVGVDDVTAPVADERPTCAAANKTLTIESKPKERLIITKIVNEWFKSYAGTVVLGPFHKNFSCIVGPNGSGKSNVIDAMLFVFGFRASKMRSKKLSVLIHNSDEHSDIQSCSVSVHFQKIIDKGDEEDNYDVVPGSQLVVTRVANRDNTSNYYINKKKSNFKEVTQLLRDQGIDLDHNRFLILQGEVEQISLMKAKAQTENDEGMLEYLEDIIGCSRYKELIADSAVEVEQFNTLRGEKLNRVKVVEKEKDELEGAKDEAMKFLKEENEITKQKHILNQKYIMDTLEHDKETNKICDGIQEEMDDVQKRLQHLINTMTERTQEHKNINKKYTEVETDCENAKKIYTEYEMRDVKCREGIKHSKSQDKKLQTSLKNEQKKLENLKDIPDRTSAEVETLKSQKEDHEVEKRSHDDKLKEVMSSLKTETAGLQSKKQEKEELLMEISKEVNETRSQLDVGRSELDLYTGQEGGVRNQLNQAKTNFNNTKTSLADKKRLLSDLEERLPVVTTELDESKAELSRITLLETQSTGLVRQARLKYEDARSHVQASRSSGRLLRALLAEKTTGNIPGILGRLGDLAAIDEKYDVAISTACSQLDNILVDTIETAETCIQHLRQHDLGRASFIALDKMNRWQKNVQQTFKTPENVPRLFDLVRVEDSKLLTAFYFVLRDTLVAKDIDQATRIAYNKDRRNRVVTLAGQLIETSGTMSGGGNRAARGRMGSSVVHDVTADEVEVMEKDLRKQTDVAQRHRADRERLETSIINNEHTSRDIKIQIEKCAMDIRALTDQHRPLSTLISDLEEKVAATRSDPKKVKQLEGKVAAFQKEFDSASARASSVEDEVLSLHKQIMEIGDKKLKKVQTKVDEINVKIDEVTRAITKSSVAVKTANRNIKKSEDKVAQFEKELQENSVNLEMLNEEYTLIEQEAMTIIQNYQDLQNQLPGVNEDLTRIKKELSELHHEEGEIKKEQLELRHKFEKQDNQRKESQNKIRHWKKENDKLELHLTDEGEGATGQLTEGEGATGQLTELSVEQLSSVNVKRLTAEILGLEERLAQMKPNMAAIAEYKQKEESYLHWVGELEVVTSQRDVKRKDLDALRKQRLDDFMRGFNVISYKLKEMYQMITLGGDAELELVDSLDPFTEGIVFSVRPPKKSWKNISNLSGGEKTLSSLALVFALHHYKPTPLYVMDEIDAALDYRNVSIVANYIKERTKDAQFVIISLRDQMFELSDHLIGIYKTYNCSKTVVINPKKISNAETQVPPEEKTTTIPTPVPVSIPGPGLV